MKKLLSYLLIIALVVVQFVPLVNATTGTYGENGSIKIQATGDGILEEATYNLYEVLKLESYDTSKDAFTYTVEINSQWYTFLTSTEGQKYVTIKDYTDTEKIVEWKTDAQAREFAEAAIAYAKANNVTPTKTITRAKGQESIEVTALPLGAYVVDSSLGALVSLNTTVPSVTIFEKNDTPIIDKTVKEDSTGQYGERNSVNIGQEVEFQTLITAQEGAKNYVLKDTMSIGLTLNEDSIVITNEGKTLTEGNEYTLTIGGENDTFTFKIDFSAEFEYSLVDDEEILVNYTAVLNEDAKVGKDGNPNEAVLTYGDRYTTQVDTTYTHTYEFNLIKSNASLKPISGAEFELYTTATGAEKINLVKVGDKYRVATPEEVAATGFKSAVIEAGTVIKNGEIQPDIIYGLDRDTYYLEETKAPEGYNKLTSRVPVTITNTSDYDSMIIGTNSNLIHYGGKNVRIVNTTGAHIPSTGGMGTVLFIAIGSVMVIGFGVLLVTKLRLSKMSI